LSFQANGYGLSEGILNFLTHLIDSDWQVYIANQQLDLWDQFNLGIRHFEVCCFLFPPPLPPLQRRVEPVSPI